MRDGGQKINLLIVLAQVVFEILTLGRVFEILTLGRECVLAVLLSVYCA